MAQYVLSSLTPGAKPLPKTLGSYRHKLDAIKAMHDAARSYLASLLTAKYATLFPPSIKLRVNLAKVAIVPYAQLQSTRQADVKQLTKEGMTKLDDVRVGEEFAMVYGNDDGDWIDVVCIEERAPAWWRFGGRAVMVKGAPRMSFAVQTLARPKRPRRHGAPSGADAQAYDAWCQNNDRLLRDLNKKLEAKASAGCERLSNSVLRFDFSDA